MAVLATFDPGNDSYGRSANALFSGMNQGLSMMERKQAMALNQQRADQQKMEFIAKLPLIQAQADLTRVNAATAVKNATDIANWETKAALESTTANKEFIEASQYNAAFDIEAPAELPEGATPEEIAAHDEALSSQAAQGKYATQQTLDARSQMFAALSAKYSYMKNLPQYQGFIDRVDKEAAASHLAAAQNLKLEELMATAQVRADQARYGVDVRSQDSIYRTDMSGRNTDVRASNRMDVEGARGANRLDVVKMQGQNQVQKEGNIIENLSSRAVAADQDAADASAAGDEAAANVFRQNAAALRDQVTHRSTYAGSSPSAPTAKDAPIPRRANPASDGAVAAEQSAAESLSRPTGATEAAPVAPTKVDSKATTVKIGGKTYPIYKDKHGKRAYLVDGHYVPIDTE